MSVFWRSLSRLVRCQLQMMTKVIMPDWTTHYLMMSPHSESTLLLVKSMSDLLSTGRQLQDLSSLYMCLMLVSKLISDWLVWLLQLLSDWIVWLLHLPFCNWCLISYIREKFKLSVFLNQFVGWYFDWIWQKLMCIPLQFWIFDMCPKAMFPHKTWFILWCQNFVFPII